MGSTGNNEKTNSNVKDLPVGFLSRFWEKVDKAGPYIVRLDSYCWVWVGALAGMEGNQYGAISVNNRQEKAHRVSYIIHYGAIPSGYHVCHKCDTSVCVNPDHLYAGSQSRNIKDSVERERWDKRGENNGNHRLTETDVIIIRRLVNAGHSQAEMARRFSVSPQHICNIIHFKKWGHVGDPQDAGCYKENHD
jgi:hypothetical protein